MVSYFYKAGYDTTTYETLEPLLHAQVVIMADKYCCDSLYQLARTSFADTVPTVPGDDWAAVASFVYDHTSTSTPAHIELRTLVVATVTGCYSVLQSTLQNESILEVLRSNGELATDLSLGALRGLKIKDEHILMCDKCHYAHSGSPDCSYLSQNDELDAWLCPQCGSGSGTTSKRYSHRVDLYRTFSCPSCDGIHTASPIEPPPAPEFDQESVVF